MVLRDWNQFLLIRVQGTLIFLIWVRFENLLYNWKIYLKALDTFGNCQRPVFLLGVSQHMHIITNLWKFELNLSSKLRDNNGRKNTLVKQSYMLSWLILRPHLEVSKSVLLRNYFFVKNYITYLKILLHSEVLLVDWKTQDQLTCLVLS